MTGWHAAGRRERAPVAAMTQDDNEAERKRISGLAFSSVADGSQMIYDCKFCDSVADLLVNLGQFW